MNRVRDVAAREEALGRARRWSPFLSSAIDTFPAIASTVVNDGADAGIRAALSVDGDTVESRLRRQRTALALVTALGDLSGEQSLEWVTQTLSDFADRAMHEALEQAISERVPGATSEGFAIIALGKLGSHELNYSSEVDLILIFDAEKLARRPREDAGEAAVRYARRFIELLQKRDADGYVARVDLRLRPSPEVTPVALPVGAAISYYESSALAWERAAFIRARAAAGDTALGQAFLDEIRPFVWRRALDFGAIEEIRDISLRIRDHFAQVQAFGPGFDLKRGRGGIREAEFFTQVQQLIHGGRDPSLRAPATLDALAALTAAGWLEPDVSGPIGDAYRALRTAEHRVQMVNDKQDHRLPMDAEALDGVARLDGLADGQAMIEALRPHVEVLAAHFDGLVDERKAHLSKDPDILARELSEAGFSDVETVMRRISEWRSGRPRSLRSPAAMSAFEAMLPPLMRAIAAGPDPMGSINRFSDIVDRLSSGVNLYRLLGARPQLSGVLALIVAHTPALAEQLGRRPMLLDGLIDDSSFEAPPSVEELVERFSVRTEGAPFDEVLDQIRLMVGERRFAFGVQMIAAVRDPIVIAEGYSDLAEAAVLSLSRAVTKEFERTYGRIEGGDLVILGLGRLGGRALTHASDLDLVYLFDAPAGAQSDGQKSLTATDYYNRLASRISAALGTPTAAGPLYDVDTRLRPQGAQGMLAVSLEAFERYQREEAWTWEHMALCRARPLTGSAESKQRIRGLICSILTERTNPAKIRADAAAMRTEMRTHKPPSGPLDIKLGDGGLVDLEFAVHTLQLTRHVGLEPSLENGIADLAREGLMDDRADADLRLLSRVLVVLRLFSPAGSMVPADASRELVASLCGHDDWDGLIASVDAARARNVERWKQVREGVER